MEMTKTLFSVPKRTLARLKDLAQRRRRSLSQLMCAAIKETYGIDAGLNDAPGCKDDSMLLLIGQLRGGPKDLSENHDHYLYGAQRVMSKRPRT